jgi:hypothetical protein
LKYTQHCSLIEADSYSNSSRANELQKEQQFKHYKPIVDRDIKNKMSSKGEVAVAVANQAGEEPKAVVKVGVTLEEETTTLEHQ